jgi:hypothetical protein
MSAEQETFDAGDVVAKKVFFVTLIGTVLFAGTVFTFIL